MAYHIIIFILLLAGFVGLLKAFSRTGYKTENQIACENDYKDLKKRIQNCWRVGDLKMLSKYVDNFYREYKPLVSWGELWARYRELEMLINVRYGQLNISAI